MLYLLFCQHKTKPLKFFEFQRFCFFFLYFLSRMTLWYRFDP